MIGLTPRERELLIVLAESNASDAELAMWMEIEPGSVRHYFMLIRKKLAANGFDVKRRSNLLAWAREHRVAMEAE